MRFGIGEVRVDSITDFDRTELPLGKIFPEADRRQLTARRDFLEPLHLDLARDMVLLTIQVFVLRVAGRIIVIDPCVGEEKERPVPPDWNNRAATGFLDRVQAAGVHPDEVDVVFCTHLHSDHVGWNTRRVDGRWVPTFKNARYLVGRREMQHWETLAAQGTNRLYAFEDSVLPVVHAGQVDLVDDGHEPAPGMTLAPFPGHTPGQMGLHVHSAGERAVFCGDAIHSPIQVLHPELSAGLDTDRNQARGTRLGILQRAASDGSWLVPAHFRGTHRAKIRTAGDAFFPDFAP